MGNASENHPLQQLFTELVNRNYEEALGRNDNELNSYVAGMLCEFCDADQLFKIRNAEGRPLHDVGEMLLESDPVYGDAPSLTANARCASTSATWRCSSPECSR